MWGKTEPCCYILVQLVQPLCTDYLIALLQGQVFLFLKTGRTSCILSEPRLNTCHTHPTRTTRVHARSKTNTTHNTHVYIHEDTELCYRWALHLTMWSIH
jgi:hypothetical protein